MADQVCDICREEPAVFLFGPIAQGAQWFGIACMARAGLDLAQTVLDAEEIAQTLGPMFVEVPKPKGAAPKSKRGERAPEAPEESKADAQPTSAEGVEEAPTAVNDG